MAKQPARGTMILERNQGAKRAVRAVALCLILLSLSSTALAREEYQRRDVSGFRVMLHPKVLKSPLCKPALALLLKKLASLDGLVPAPALTRLKAFPLWVHVASDSGAMVYHPSADWLKEHGLNPAMARGIEISNLENFIAWCSNEQPMMVLHELAHAYHDNVLGPTWPPLMDAYRNAMKSKLYEAVPYVLSSQKTRAYALNNEDEYFAELSEAYFGKNDYFPYTRSELKAFDPVGYKMVDKAWTLGR